MCVCMYMCAHGLLVAHCASVLQVLHAFSGPQDLDMVQHMRDCNPHGPLAVQIVKLFPKQVSIPPSAGDLATHSKHNFAGSWSLLGRQTPVLPPERLSSAVLAPARAYPPHLHPA